MENQVQLVGLVERGKNGYIIRVKRKSGISDRIPIITKVNVESNTYVLIRGRFKGSYIKADEVIKAKPDNYNDIFLEGVIQLLAYDTVNNTVKISLKVHNDIIQCKACDKIAELSVGSKIRVAGKIHSKEDSVNGEIKIDYEVKVKLLEVV